MSSFYLRGSSALKAGQVLVKARGEEGDSEEAEHVQELFIV